MPSLVSFTGARAEAIKGDSGVGGGKRGVSGFDMHDG